MASPGREPAFGSGPRAWGGAAPAPGTHLDVLVVRAAPAVGQRGALALPVLQQQHGPQRHEHAEEHGAAVVEEPAGLRGRAGAAVTRVGPVGPASRRVLPLEGNTSPVPARRPACLSARRPTDGEGVAPGWPLIAAIQGMGRGTSNSTSTLLRAETLGDVGLGRAYLAHGMDVKFWGPEGGW